MVNYHPSEVSLLSNIWYISNYHWTLVRQEKLLKTLMQSVVNLTQRENPLDVKLPLYVFSRTSAFEGVNGAPMPASGIAAPLPDAVVEGQTAAIQPEIQPLLGVPNHGYTSGISGLTGAHPAQRMSMHNGMSYGSPSNGMWDAQYVTPSPPSYPSGTGSYMH